jgi:hypothetical protein
MSSLEFGYVAVMWLGAIVGLWKIWQMRQRGALGTLSERLRNPLIYLPFVFLFQALFLTSLASR